jgi:hypothetical protein
VPKPLSTHGIGVDVIPEHIKKSHFDGNDLEIRKHRSLAHQKRVSIFVKQNFSVKGILS